MPFLCARTSLRGKSPFTVFLLAFFAKLELESSENLSK